MRGGVFYIHSLELAGAELLIKFLGDPEKSAVVRELFFSGVKEYREEWYDRDEECIEMLIGLHEEPKAAGVEYMLHTDQRELWFYTEAAPKVEDIASSAA